MTGVAVVIEDDEAISALVAAYLERAGFQVVCEHTGEKGLNAVERHDPRVVVLDLALPDVEGLELCRQLRASRGVPIVILTARDEEDAVAAPAGVKVTELQPSSTNPTKISRLDILRSFKQKF